MLAAGIHDELANAGQRIKVAHDRRGIAQIANRLEEWNDDKIGCDDLRILRSERAAHHAAFFLQQQHFEQIAHRLGVADDIVTNRFRAEVFAQTSRGLENRQFARCRLGILRVDEAHWPRIAQDAHQQCLLLILRQGRVIRRNAGNREQFCDRFFMSV